MPLKIVYLYMSQGSAPQNANVDWDPNTPCISRYTDNMKYEGPSLMLSELKRTGVVDDVKIFYESNRGPGCADWGCGLHGWVCPQIKWANQFIDKDTIIYVRGGFRGWHELLTSKKNINWLMAYTANTGRERWTFWDIILWDLNKNNNLDRHGRLWYHYVKPIDEKTFYPMNQDPFYDVCIGASHIHDKKGQWRVIDALILYKKKYGVNLKAIMPGFGIRGTQTRQIRTKIIDHRLDVTITGMLSKPDLCRTVYNRSKIGVFTGTHGQGDRGPIEALACGMPVILGMKKYHSPYVYDDRVAAVPKSVHDIGEIADLIHRFLKMRPNRKRVRSYFESHMGFKEVCYPNIKFIFDFLRDNPKPTIEAKKELLLLCMNKPKESKSLGT